tara:strand:- start:145 stop:717 length:573 start_codon:yes stop_codon:yes gene_type:complete
MRIIGGNYKGKKLFLPNDRKTRPLKDLVKESIFNLIQHSNKINLKIENSIVLDLFAGIGSFGIECLSRGAKKVIFFENYPQVINVLKKNLKSLKKNKNYEVFLSDCFDFFESKNQITSKFDIIFLDPPYREVKINKIIEKIIEKKYLNKNGIIIIHRHKKDSLVITNKIKVFEERNYGISKIFFCDLNIL